MPWIYLAIAIIAEVTGTMALRASDAFTHLLPSIIVVIAYAIAFYFLSLTLRVIPVGVAYAIWAGAGIILIALFGLILFKQHLDLPAIAGIGCIITGIFLMTVVSRSVPH